MASSLLMTSQEIQIRNYYNALSDLHTQAQQEAERLFQNLDPGSRCLANYRELHAQCVEARQWQASRLRRAIAELHSQLEAPATPAVQEVS
jgi:hypothetical protein